MTVSNLLLFLIPSLAALGTLILGLGQHQHAMSLVAVFAAITSAVFTDWLKWYRLHPMFANLIALVAMGYSFIRFTDPTTQTQLISVANLLIYLQIILLYQEKNLRIYWHICLLSLLQVVVAAALNLGPQFGMLLIVYLFLTLVTATLLFIRGESLRQLTARRTSAAVASGTNGGLAAATRAPIEFASRSTDMSQFENSMLNRQLLLRLVWLCVSTIMLTTAVFFLIPRFGNDQRRGPKSNSDRLVGFSPQLILGEIGNTLENKEVVMRAQFTKEDGTPFNVLIDPYFRGNVLSKYVPGQSLWLDAGESFFVRTMRLLPAPDENIVQQTVVLETDGPLFSVFPVFAADIDSNLAFRQDPHRMLLIQDDEPQRGQRKYGLSTTTFRNGIQRRLAPAHRQSRLPGRLMPLLELQESRFPQLCAVAKELIAQSDITEGDHQAMAKLLESHFRATGGYTYTLNQQNAPPSGTDPIEYFVSDHRSGHCEYFASALCLMLRSVDVPARIVVGFHGGEYNRVGHYFLVRQLHAHAWVEAFVTRQQLEEFPSFDGIDTSNGAWLRLDPTPSRGSDSVATSGGGFIDRFSQVGDFLEVLWTDYVVGLDSTRQREAIYRPIMERTSASFREVILNPVWWGVFASELRAALGLESIESFRNRWVNWRSIPLLAVFFFGALALRRLWRRVAPWLLPRLAKLLRIRRNSWSNDPQLAWYRRLERYFARRGCRRELTQTHRDFVIRASQEARQEPSFARQELALQLVEQFYRVRFGGQRLTDREVERLEQQVRRLESSSVSDAEFAASSVGSSDGTAA